MTDKELKQLVASLAIKSDKLDEQMKCTDEKLEKVSELLGNIGRNQGDVSEEFFYNSLLKDIRLGDVHFDSIAKSLKDHRGKTQEEYDIVMTNGHAGKTHNATFPVFRYAPHGLQNKPPLRKLKGGFLLPEKTQCLLKYDKQFTAYGGVTAYVVPRTLG